MKKCSPKFVTKLSAKKNIENLSHATNLLPKKLAPKKIIGISQKIGELKMEKMVIENFFSHKICDSKMWLNLCKFYVWEIASKLANFSKVCGTNPKEKL